MLVEQKLSSFLNLISQSNKEELAWMNGYLNGIVAKLLPQETTLSLKNSHQKITIAYGTETGNSKKLASAFASKAKSLGIHSKVQSLDQYRLHDLTKEEYFLAVISTHGDGEPPSAAKKFYDHVHLNGFKLHNLKYSVLALGDTAYPLFCKAGEDVDTQLANLGGKRILPIQKCDIDFDEEANRWFDAICNSINANAGSQVPIVTIPVAKKSTGKKYYEGQIITHIILNDTGSNKETYHIEIEAEGLNYLPGDSIGIIPENDPALVNEIIALHDFDTNFNIDYKDELLQLQDLLLKKLNLIYLPERVVKHYAQIVQQDIPVQRMDLINLLKIYPAADKTQFLEIIKILEPIIPRLYSIASAPEAQDGEVHITVSKNNFNSNNEKKNGLASGFLSELKVGTKLQFYIHPNNSFRLPEDDKNIIMIGPGTGIAPFRSFIATRDCNGASGKNWLFFGEQHFTTDFLYQTEIQNWVETCVLTKVSTAFSRDQPEKIYVQHKIVQQGAEFFEWLQAGSYVYVCGSKYPMSKDVEESILQIIEQYGEQSKQEAIEYLDRLKEEGRYLTDVY